MGFVLPLPVSVIIVTITDEIMQVPTNVKLHVFPPLCAHLAIKIQTKSDYISVSPDGERSEHKMRGFLGNAFFLSVGKFRQENTGLSWLGLEAHRLFLSQTGAGVGSPRETPRKEKK